MKKPEEKGKFVKAILEHLKRFETPSTQEPYLEKLRDLTNIPIDVLRRDLNRPQTHVKDEKLQEENVLTVRENGNIKAEKFILAAILHKKDYVNKSIDYKKLLSSRMDLVDIAQSGKSISSLFDEFDVYNNPLLQDMIYFNFEEFSGNEETYFNECVWSVAEEILKERQAKLSLDFSKSTDINERRNIMQQMQVLLKKIKDKNLEDFYGWS